MKTLILLLLTYTTPYCQTQYNLFTTKIMCPPEKQEMATAGASKIKSAMNALVADGKLLNYVFDLEKNKENIKMIFTVSAESDSKFKEIITDWKKRTEKTDAEFFKTFWQVCKQKDSIMNNHKIMYPIVKALWSPVAVVEDIDEKPDPNMEYNIVFDFTAYNKVSDDKNARMDSASVNWGLNDIGRIYNLHIAAGVPKERIHFVAAVHAFAQTSFFTNEAYQKKYKIDNPNLSIIDELNKAGVRFLLCGQSLTWMGFNKSMLIPQAKVTLTAQTTLSSYQLKGYALKAMENE